MAAALVGTQVAAPQQAGANPAGTALVISEVYGAGGNSGAVRNADFIELFNPTSSPISLSGMYLHYCSSTGGSGGNVALSGSVPARGHWLVGMAPGSTGAALPAVDQSGTLQMATAAGRTYLKTSSSTTCVSGDDATVVDMVSQSGASSFEGTAGTAQGSAGQSLQRKAHAARVYQDTDNTAADIVAATPTPKNRTSIEGGGGTPTEVVAADPGDKTVAVNQPISPITLAATGGTAPYTFTASPLPAGLSLSGATISGTPTATGATTVTITATDSSSPAKSDTETFAITVTNPADPTPISAVQGTGATSPMVGSNVTVQGRVTAVYDTVGSSLDGFYVQTAGSGGATDATPGASDAVFVYGGSGFETSPEASSLEIGDSVRVSGTVGEFNGMTQVTYTAVTELGSPLPPVTPLALPWTAFDTDAEKEAHEGELLAPVGDFTVTNAYGQDSQGNWYGEIGLAAGDRPLVQPTEVVDAQTGDRAGVEADNAARRVTLDDGTSLNYRNAAQQDMPMPWWGAPVPARLGAAVTFTGSVVLEYRNSLWKLQPTSPLTGADVDGTGTATFENTRTLQPEDVGGDLRMATFNVLNYFPTTGEEYVASGGSCTWYTDRDDNRITVDDCGTPTATSGNGVRGAANEVSLARQQRKLVNAINSLDVSIVALEEIENSARFGKNRDFAVSRLVDALNAAPGVEAGTWAYAASPANRPPVSVEDVIRNAFIYKPADVELVGPSRILVGSAAFDNAREPLAQWFKPAGAPDSEAFVAITNHFKSKGGADDSGNGQGASNADRVAQAEALSAFADDVADDVAGTGAVFLLGDFNAYSKEDPVQVLEADGYTRVVSDDEDDTSYSYQGLSGSLDHVFANATALDLVTGADIWEINANESVIFEYSRFNYNVTEFFDPTTPFSASDHNPMVVGLDLGGGAAEPVDVTVAVTSSAGGPVSQPCVYLYETPEAPSATYASCGQADGLVGLLGVAPGDYTLAVNDPSGGHATYWSEEPVTLDEGTTTVPLEVTLEARADGVVRGTVTDADGPVSGACVYLYDDAAGPAAVATCTGADGGYWLGDVDGSVSYKLAVADPTGAHRTQWWTGAAGGASDYAGGAVLGSTAGGATVTADVVLEAVREGAIAGVVTAGGSPLGGTCVYAYEDGESAAASYATCALLDGSYHLGQVANGGYDVAFFDPTGNHLTQWWTGTEGGAGTQSGATPVDVDSATVAGIDAVMAPVP